MNAKTTAKQIAKQMAREPLEILRAASKQVAPIPETEHTGEKIQSQGEENRSPEPSENQKKEKEIKSQRLMEAYNAEIEDIRKSNLFADIQRRISEGEDVSLAEYGELTIEQRQVLEAQKEAMKARRQQEEAVTESPLQIVSKKGRKMFGNIGLKREQTKVEMRQPPSS